MMLGCAAAAGECDEAASTTKETAPVRTNYLDCLAITWLEILL